MMKTKKEMKKMKYRSEKESHTEEFAPGKTQPGFPPICERDVPVTCSSCGHLYNEMICVVWAKETRCSPLLCLSCDPASLEVACVGVLV